MSFRKLCCDLKAKGSARAHALLLRPSPMSVIQIATLSYIRLRTMMMTKLMQEAVTEVASCGVMKGPTTCRFVVGLSFMMLAKAAYTARR